MKHVLLYVGGAVVVLVGGFFILNNFIYTEKQGDTLGQDGYKDIAYTIEGQEILLVNGSAETPSATGTAQIVTTYVGNEAEGDLNEDGVSDIAFILTQDHGGSGTFYYVVAALKTDTGYEGTTAGSIGDRITPESVTVQGGVITVQYARPLPGSPITSTETQNVSKQFVVVDGALVSPTSL
jgi:hypothetical protein